MTIAAPIGLGRVTSRTHAAGGLLPVPSPFGAPGPYVYDATSAKRIPAVGRSLQLIGGMVKQMPMDAYRGYQQLTTPRLLTRPDPNRGGGWFVQVSVEDYLLNGNAIALVTARGADGWPLSVVWLPTTWVKVVWFPWNENNVAYYYAGTPLPVDDVIHVRRGADRQYPVRGIGIVEEYLSSLDRIAMEEEYERGALAGGAVPSMAVITPQATLTPEVAQTAKDQWMTNFSGPQREPVILPNGTQVLPLAWSPTDTQLSEARQLSLVDVANMFNLDGYWLGAPVAGMTYRTAGPQYQQILRTTLEPVLADFEDVWSDGLLPRGTSIRFRRSQLLREDLPTSMAAAVAGYNARLMTLGESRVMIGLPPSAPGLPTTDVEATGDPADLIASPDDPNDDPNADDEPAPLSGGGQP